MEKQELKESKKKNVNKKRIIIIVSSVLLAFVIMTISLSVMYHPRKLSSLIDVNVSDVDKIYLEDSNGVSYETKAYNKEEITKALLNIKVVPKYFNHEKVTTTYRINLVVDDAVYEVNPYYAHSKNKTKYFETQSFNKFEEVCKAFGYVMEY